MLKVTDEMLATAKNTVAHGDPEAVGYRVLIKPIEATKGLTPAEQARFKALAEIGFENKSDKEKQRVDRGSNFGIIVSIGEHAFMAKSLGGKKWVEEGDIAIIDRYSGAEIESPPGSENMYRFANDESVLGCMRPTVPVDDYVQAAPISEFQRISPTEEASEYLGLNRNV